MGRQLNTVVSLSSSTKFHSLFVNFIQMTTTIKKTVYDWKCQSWVILYLQVTVLRVLPAAEMTIYYIYIHLVNIARGCICIQLYLKKVVHALFGGSVLAALK